MGWKDRFSSRDPREAFIEKVTAGFRKAAEVSGVAAGADDFTLMVTFKGSTQQSTVHLHNLWADLQAVSERDRRAEIGRFVRGIVSKAEEPTTLSEAAPRLMPAVRASSILAQTPLDLVTSPLAPLVNLHSVLDSPDTMRFVTVADATLWGVDEAVVRVRATANLRASPLGHVSHPTIPGARIVVEPDGYAASWLIASEPLRQVLPPSAGRLLALAPSRDLLCVVREDDELSVGAALEWASEMYRTSARNLSPVAYIVEANGVRPWVPPLGHAAAAAANLSSALLVAGEYGYQQADLQQWLGQGVFVAPLSLFQRDDGTVVSRVVWTAHLQALLPKADEIYFNDVDDLSTPFTATWDAVAAVAGDSLTPATGLGLDLLLPRWRVSDWPDASAIASLRTATA